MRARLVVFPVRGRNWCFGRCKDPSSVAEAAAAAAANTPSTFRDLWNNLSSSSSSSSNNSRNAELFIDFFSTKMNRAWMRLEKAPEGSFKNKLHGLGLRLLTRLKPSEIFLKSVSKEVTCVQITYPSSLNPRLVRRRLRHIATRGAVIHKKYLYGSASLLPLTAAFAILPLPNIPFFWVLFRTYSHWRALQGSEKLLQLVSDGSDTEQKDVSVVGASDTESNESGCKSHDSQCSLWELQPSKELEEILRHGDEIDGLSDAAFLSICKTYSLDLNDVQKFRHTT